MQRFLFYFYFFGGVGGRDVIGFICLRDLFETLSSSKKAECFRVCFHCPSGVAIVSFNRLYRIRPYTPDDMANFSGAVLVGMILTPLDYVRLQLDHNASRACNHIALRHFIMTRSVQVLSWTKGASCSQFHSYRKSILGKLTKNFACKSAAINICWYPSFVMFLLFLSCFSFPLPGFVMRFWNTSGTCSLRPSRSEPSSSCVALVRSARCRSERVAGRVSEWGPRIRPPRKPGPHSGRIGRVGPTTKKWHKTRFYFSACLAVLPEILVNWGFLHEANWLTVDLFTSSLSVVHAWAVIHRSCAV